MPEEVVVSWSGGKESWKALDEVRRDPSYEVAGLVTTVTQDYGWISMHGVRCELLELQAASLGLPLHKILISKGATNEEYETKMREVNERLLAEGVAGIVFGDLFLEDIRRYREEKLAPLGLKCLFPIWGRNTSELIRAYIERGYRAVLSCVDPKALSADFAGRMIDEPFLADLQAAVDPCGENGELHTFVFAGPVFKHEVRLRVGERVRRGGLCFCDLIPC